MTLRPSSRAWLVVALIAIAVVAGVVWWLGPGSEAPRPDATATPVPTRTWLIRPSGATRPAKDQTDLAVEVFRVRIRGLGIGNFSSIAADDITFELPEDADEAAIRAILSANGVLSFVPLPPEDYGEGGLEARVGEPLPKAEPELFGADDIASSGVATEAGVPARIHFTLLPAAAAVLQTYTANSIGQTFAILLDGKVALLPTVEAPISDGRLEISGGNLDRASLLVVAAIATSGALPESWWDPIVE
jgi:SecD/SecF fusion protein